LDFRAQLVIALTLGACWRGGDDKVVEPAPTAPQKGASCQQTADNAHAVIAKAEDEQLAARAPALRTIVVRRCELDGWSMELRRCVAGATSVADANTCDKLATAEQKRAFEHDVEVMIVSEDGQ
jgi:hypothetical protein